MYPSIRTGHLRSAAPGAVERGVTPPGRATRGIDRNVVNLGLTSFFTDISSESVTAILPLYLAYQLRFSPLQIGAFLGLYQAVAALLNIVGGVIADHTTKRKAVATTGYAMSATCRLGLLAAGGAWLPTTAFLMLDRTGKGVRAAPRDALISLSADPSRLGTAFGIHRALDTAGAVIGPFMAFWLLSIVPNQFDVVFVASFCASLIGLAIIVLFVQNRGTRHSSGQPTGPTIRGALRLWRVPAYRTLAIAGFGLGLFTISDAFVYLTFLQRSTLQTKYFPLLYVGTALSYLVCAVPAGALADRFGRVRVFLAGTALLLGVDALLLLPDPGAGALLAILALLGVFYACTDGVLMALASTAIPPHLRTTGMAVVTTAVTISRLAASVAFGAIWGIAGPDGAVKVFGIGLAVMLPVCAAALGRRKVVYR
jgi:MFS family permease